MALKYGHVDALRTGVLIMALSINTNVSSLNATRHLMKSTGNMGRTFERLSSGMRINGARDDAAGLSISTRMTAQIRGMNMAIRNTNDAISLVQVAEGALVETQNAMQRIRELAIQANTATMTDTDKNDLQKEVTQLMAEIQRISSTTEFNNQKVIDGTFQAKRFQVGPDVGQTLTVTIGSADTKAIGLSTGAVFMSIGSGAANANLIDGAITRIDLALDSVSDMRANLGAYQNRFESLIANLSNVSENTVAARSRIMDADIATETANLTKNAIMQQAGTAILAQANQQPQIALQLLG
jgi:flagellin